MVPRLSRVYSRRSLLGLHVSSWKPPSTHRQLHTSNRKEAEDSENADQKSAYERSVASLNIDPENKTVTTAAGSLPLSPVMDPSFHDTRNKYTKMKPRLAPYKDKFQRQIERNPYAHMLAEGVRTCDVTGTALPRSFLQRFKLLQHPTAETTWWVPQDLESSVPIEEGGKTKPVTELPGPSAYTLNSRLFLREFTVPKGLYSSGSKRLLRQTDSGTGRLSPVLAHAQWRGDMDTYLLEAMRKRIYERLLHAAIMSEKGGEDGRPRKYIIKLNSWAEVNELKHRQCVLVFGPPEGDSVDLAMMDIPAPLSTMTLPNSKFGAKLAVHDMRAVLGEVYLVRLRQESELLRDGSRYLLAKQATMKLHALIWRLQEYITGWDEPLPDVEDGSSTMPQTVDNSAATLDRDESSTQEDLHPQRGYEWELALEDELEQAENLRD